MHLTERDPEGFEDGAPEGASKTRDDSRTTSRGSDQSPGPMELPPPRRTLLGRFASWIEHAHALRAGIERARGRSATLDATLETIEHDSEIGGGMLAGALSYRLFVFALPLAVFIISGLGVLASALGREPSLVADSVGLAGVVTAQIAETAGGDSSWWVALTSFLALVYTTRVLFRAVTIVHSLAWQHSAASVRVRSRSLGIFGAALAGQLVLVSCVNAVDHRTAIGGRHRTRRICARPHRAQVAHADARWADLIPGSLFYAIGVTGVLVFNAVVLGSLIQSKTSTYGALGTAATLLFAFFLLGRVIVGAAVLNATLYERRSRSDVRQR